MATNLYVNADLIAGKLAASANLAGQQNYSAVITYSKTASDNDTSVLRFVKAIPANAIIRDVRILNAAISGCTAVAVGFYAVQKADGTGGAIVGSGNQLAAALDLSSARASGAEGSAVTAVSQANRAKRVYELAGHTEVTKLDAYDLALTLTTGGTNTGVITLLVDYIQG